MRTFLGLLLCAAVPCLAQELKPLPNTQPFTQSGDISAQMVEGIGRWLDRETEHLAQKRNEAWKAAAAGNQWDAFVAAQREKLKTIIGAVDARTPGPIEEIQNLGEERPPTALGASGGATIFGGRVARVQWPVFDGVHGEGILYLPAGQARAAIIAVPDADQVPERFPLAQKLAQQGCLVLVPVLVDRGDKWSGSDLVKRYTNEPGREWIYRQSFELGRTIIGYEAQKIFAAVDALALSSKGTMAPGARLGIAGYGEGGLLALQSAALDPRFDAALVSGYFGPREKLYREPIYRNLFGYLKDFGDAQLAAMIAPRKLIVEYSREPAVSGPPAPDANHKGAAPGSIITPASSEVAAEAARATEWAKLATHAESLGIFPSSGEPVEVGESPAPNAFLLALNVPADPAASSQSLVIDAAPSLADERQRRTVRELERFTQGLVRVEELGREEAVGAHIKPGPEWDAARKTLKTRLAQECIGTLPSERLPANPQTRQIRDEPKWTGYEVRLDVMPDVFAWGWLLVPKDLKPGERRPVVVCQHGLEGLPEDTVSEAGQAYAYYKAFAARLAEQGFIVYAPHNPYRGKDNFRVLQRKANPIGLSLFSFIIAQHDVTTQWLASLPFVDPSRIAFYGLSYGGKTALRVPAFVDRYCLSICAGDFNEWIYKVVSDEYRAGYAFSNEYEMSEWNLGAVANHSEMAMLIAPRPFMVERGHSDGVGLDEFVGYEFAKVLHGYTKLGVADRTEIEWFDGPHTIHGVGTFAFLHKWLRWPVGP